MRKVFVSIMAFMAINAVVMANPVDPTVGNDEPTTNVAKVVAAKPNEVFVVTYYDIHNGIYFDAKTKVMVKITSATGDAQVLFHVIERAKKDPNKRDNIKYVKFKITVKADGTGEIDLF